MNYPAYLVKKKKKNATDLKIQVMMKYQNAYVRAI